MACYSIFKKLKIQEVERCEIKEYIRRQVRQQILPNKAIGVDQRDILSLSSITFLQQAQ